MFVGSFICSCRVISVVSNCDSKTDFGKYKTFAFTSRVTKAIGGNDGELIFRAIDDEMFLRGYLRKIDSADVLITISKQDDLEILASAADQPVKSIGFVQQAMPGISKTKSPNGTVVISVFDFRSRKLIWQGRGRHALDDNDSVAEHEAKVNYSVNMILRTYPIKSRRGSYNTR
jgi:hypothetical protein